VKLIHGDSNIVLNEIEENSIDIVVTDPPYEVLDRVKWDLMPSVNTFKSILRVMKPNTPAFIMSAPRQDLYLEMLSRIKEAGFKINYNSIYWLYNTATIKGKLNREKGYISGLNYRNSTELIIVASKPKSTHEGGGNYGSFQSPIAPVTPLITKYYNKYPIFPSTFLLDTDEPYGLSENTVRLHSMDTWWNSIFLDIRKPIPSELKFIKRNPADKYSGMFMNSRIDRDDGNNHLTVKPVKLFTYLLTTFSSPDKTVLDPFAGTGTIFPAARNAGMDAIGIEFQQSYVNIIKRRMEMEGIDLEVIEG